MPRAPSDFRFPVAGRKAHRPAPIIRPLGRFACAATLLAVAACSDQPAPLDPTMERPAEASALRVPASGTYSDLSARDRTTCAVRTSGVSVDAANGWIDTARQLQIALGC